MILRTEFKKMFSNSKLMYSIIFILLLSVTLFSVNTISSDIYQNKQDVIDSINLGKSTDDTNKYIDEVLNISDNHKIYVGNINDKGNSYLKKHYSKFNDYDLGLENTMAIQVYSDQFFSGFALIIIGIIVVNHFFEVEASSGLDSVCVLTRNGGKKVTFYKFMVLVIIILSASFILNLFFILASQFLLGFVNLNLPLQNVIAFFESPYAISITEMMIATTLNMSLIAIGLSSLYWVFTKNIGNHVLSILLVLLIIFLEGVLYYSISPHSSINILRNVNIFAMLFPKNIVGKLNAYNVGFIVSSLQITLILCFVLIPINLCILLHQSDKLWGKKNLNWSLPFFKGSHVKILLHEIFKVMIISSGTVIIMLFLGYFINNSKVEKIDFSGVIYYYEKIGTNVNAESEAIIDEIFLNFSLKEDEFKEVSSLYEKGLIPHQEYTTAQDNYIQQINDFQNFQYFVEDYNNAYSNNIQFSSGFQAIFGMNTQERDIIYGLLSLVAIVLLLSNIHGIDRNNSEDDLYSMNIKNNFVRLKSKIYIGIVIAVLITLIVTFLDTYYFSKLYPMLNWNLPLSSIMRQGMNINLSMGIQESISIKNYFILLILLRIVGLLFIAQLTSLLSYVFKNRTQVIVISIFFSLVPFVIYIAGISGFINISVFDIIASNIFMLSAQSLLKITIVLVLTAILMGLPLYIEYKKLGRD